jgi:hypothetical protein
MNGCFQGNIPPFGHPWGITISNITRYNYAIMRLETKSIITILIPCPALAYHLQPVAAASSNLENSISHHKILNQENTPIEDGIITHTVKYGETLFTISQAYGVPIDQILSNSSLGQTTTEICEGQVHLIQTA